MVQAPLGRNFEDCAFSQKIKQLWTKFPVDLDKVFRGTQESQFYISRDHCCEVTVK